MPQQSYISQAFISSLVATTSYSSSLYAEVFGPATSGRHGRAEGASDRTTNGIFLLCGPVFRGNPHWKDLRHLYQHLLNCEQGSHPHLLGTFTQVPERTS